MNLFYQPDLPSGSTHLDPEESRHCIRVLRKRVGDLIDVTDGKGFFYGCRIIRAQATRCTFAVESQREEPPVEPRIHIAVSLLKNSERIEWFTEKAVEIGVSEISFFHGDRSERKVMRMGRVRKIAVSAMKQAFRSWLPVIRDPMPLQALIDLPHEDKRMMAALRPGAVPLQREARGFMQALVLVGPEGGFTDQEVNACQSTGFRIVSLGSHRLRTETAAIVACTLLHNSRT